MDFKVSWKVYMLLLCCDWLAVKFIRAFLAGYTFLIWYRYLYIKNYKAVNTYHKVFCYPENVNTKWENESNSLRCELYAMHLYRVLWELNISSLPSFIMKYKIKLCRPNIISLHSTGSIHMFLHGQWLPVLIKQDSTTFCYFISV